MSKATAMTALAGALIALVVVGGFLALDRTVLHFYTSSDDAPPTPPPTQTKSKPIVSPTEEAGPAFSVRDVLALAQSDLAERPFPGGTRFVLCLDAEYRSGNHLWIVGCGYYVEDVTFVGPSLASDRLADVHITLILDDRTGRVQR